MYEAARAICNLPGVEMNDLSPAINVLQVLLILISLIQLASQRKKPRYLYVNPVEMDLLGSPLSQCHRRGGIGKLLLFIKKNLNACRPYEHPPLRWGMPFISHYYLIRYE